MPARALGVDVTGATVLLLNCGKDEADCNRARPLREGALPVPPAPSYPLTTAALEPAGALEIGPDPIKRDLPNRTMRVLAYDIRTNDVIAAYLAPESALLLALDLGSRFNLFPAARAAVGSVWRLAPQPRSSDDGPVFFAPDVTRVIVRAEAEDGNVLVSALNGSGDVGTQYVCYAYLLPLPEEGGE